MLHGYKIGDFNIILDINSGSVHSVDSVAFDAILMLEDDENSKEDVIKSLTEKYPNLRSSEISELFEDISYLRDVGKLYSQDVYKPNKTEKPSPTVKAMCLNIAHACNMSCTYCFAGRGEYGSDEGLMSLETGKAAIDFLINNSQGRRNLDIDFFGGEPLLGWDTVKQLVLYAQSIEAQHGKNFRFTLTTNGLLLDDDVIEFSSKHMHNVVLSLDGRKSINDKFRILNDGSGSYDAILPKFKEITKARGDSGYYIRGTFTAKNKDFVNDILHIAKLGFKEISLEPAVSKPGSELGFVKEDLPELFEQYEKLALEMLDASKNGNEFSFYHFNLDLSSGPCVHKRIAGCGVGTEYLAVTPSGKLYPCHQFIGDEEFIIGDVFRGITNKALREEFELWDIYSREECKSCWARFYCSGGCAANAYNDMGSISGVYELGCELFKKRIECAIMMKVAQL